MIRSLLSVLGVMAALAVASPAFAMVNVRDMSVDGVPVWYAEDNAVPVVHLTLVFEEAGTVSDPDALGGRARLAVALLNEGAGEYSSLAFHKALEAKAIQFSAYTEQDDLVVELHTLKDQLPEAVRLATLALTNPRFDAGAIEKAKITQLTRLKQMRESPAVVAKLAWIEAMYGNHPYGKSGVGDEHSIAALARSDLESYRTRYITRANLQVAAAGDVSRTELKNALEPLVDALPEAFFPERDLAGVALDGKGEISRIDFDVPQSVVVFGGPGVNRADKKYYAAYLMNTAFGSGSLTSRLMRDVRVKKGLVYGISTGFANGANSDSFIGQFATRNESVDDAIAAVKEAVEEINTKGISARECKEIKKEVIQQFILGLDSTESIASVIAMMMRYDLGKDYLEKRAALFEDVRCKDIEAAAREWLTPDRWRFVVVGGKAAAPAKPKADAPAAEATP